MTCAWAIKLRRISVYMFAGDGLSDRNCLLLVEAAATCLASDVPWCLAGGLNLPPESLRQGGFLKKLGGVIVGPGQPTCFQAGPEYDYFVLANPLAVFATALLTQRLHHWHWSKWSG